MEDKIRNAIEEAMEKSPERKFVQTLEMAFTLRDIDLKNPKNRIQEEVRLPKGRGKKIRIAIFATGEMASKAKGGELEILDPATISDLGDDKKAARKIADKYHFFLSEVPHMALIGRHLGIVLGPRGKMPRPVPPVVDPAGLAQVLQSTVVVRSRDRVTFHTSFGSDAQTMDDLNENALAIFNRVISRLDRGVSNLRSLYIKTSMGPSVAVGGLF